MWACMGRMFAPFLLEFDAFANVCGNVFYLDAYLLHCIAVADGYATVFFGIKVVGNAENGADFVLTAVAFAD